MATSDFEKHQMTQMSHATDTYKYYDIARANSTVL